MLLPSSIAPYQVLLSALNIRNEEVSAEADSLYRGLQDAGLEVLYDDRDESAGVKFKDADLLGLPIRVVVSPRNLREDAVEIKTRSEEDPKMVPCAEAVSRVKELLAG